jgi:hypothetical protein
MSCGTSLRTNESARVMGAAAGGGNEFIQSAADQVR